MKRTPIAIAVAAALGSVALACAVAMQPAMGAAPASQPAGQSLPLAGKGAAAIGAVRYHPERFAGRAGRYYELVWGVDALEVKWAESGEMIRFTYRVLDPLKAAVLNDNKAEPSLIDQRAGVSLVVPALENVGKLRQSRTPETGKMYWMAFSNKGRLVKRGDHVTVVIGEFKAEGLVVD
jgi:hypothetical protein